MNSNYLAKYNINKVYKNTDIQSILIGSSKEKLNQYFIINILNDKRIAPKKFKDKINLLHNLDHFEDTGTGIVLVTSINEGIELVEYINQNSKLDIRERINLASSYLQKTTNYDGFSNDIREILVREDQVVIKDEDVLLNEIIIIEEDFAFQEYGFNKVAESVGNVLEKIFYSKISHEYYPASFNGLIEFINNIKYSIHNYKSLLEIYNAFEKLSNNILSGSTMPVPVQQDNNITSRRRQARKKHFPVLSKKSQGFGLALAIAVSALLWASGGNIYKNSEHNPEVSSLYSEENLPEDHLQDNNQNISEMKNYENISLDDDWQADHLSDNLQSFAISYETPEYVIADEKVFRSGQYSLKFQGTKNNIAKTIYLHNNIEISKDEIYTLSLWLKSDAQELITINIAGYNEKLLFQQSIEYIPYAKGRWEMVKVDLPSNESAKIKMSLVNNSTVWIDDIKIDIYK